MRWKGGRQSDNVEDRRGVRMGGRAAMGGGGLIGIVIALVAIFVFKMDPRKAMQLANVQKGNKAEVQQGNRPLTAEEKEMGKMVSTILADTEDVWHKLFSKSERQYVDPKLVMFTGEVQSACGRTSAAVGPFYCPADKKVYIDLSFFHDLANQHKAPGDFAQAYVIAHEVGHHVQNLLGVSSRVHAMQQRVSKTEANELSVRLELQADFFAGVWAHHAHLDRQILERGDIEEALKAAVQIGDDTLQKQARGYVRPESFTHGTSEQRVRWFRKGLETGDMSQGDTFGLSATAL